MTHIFSEHETMRLHQDRDREKRVGLGHRKDLIRDCAGNGGGNGSLVDLSLLECLGSRSETLRFLIFSSP